MIIKKAIQISGLGNYVLYLMQCFLKGVHVSEFPEFLADSPSETTHAIKVIDHFDNAHPLFIQLQLSSTARYFDVYSLSIAEYENEEIPKIHITAEELPLDPSIEEYSEHET